MSGHGIASLREFLVSHYEELRKRLTYKLGNADMASDALHDAYLRLKDNDGGADGHDPSVTHPGAYLYRMAFHIAVDHERGAERRLTSNEVEGVLEIADQAPGPARIAEGRGDLERLLQEMEALPRRCREILLAVRLDGASREQLAARYGISLRTVDRELEKAYAFCLERMNGEQR